MHPSDANAPSKEAEKVSTGQAAELLGVDRSTIFRAVKRGELDAETFHLNDQTYYRIAMEDLTEYQRKREDKVLNVPLRRSQSGPPKAVA